MVYWCCVFLFEMHAQLASCDPCELQGLRQCYHQLPITLSVFGSLRERVRCDFFLFFFSLRVNYKFHVDVVYWLPMTSGVFRWLQERMQCCLVRFGKWDTKVILRCFQTRPMADEGTVMLCVRDSKAILWLERASLSRVLCQTMTMQRAMELKSGYQ